MQRCNTVGDLVYTADKTVYVYKRKNINNSEDKKYGKL